MAGAPSKAIPSTPKTRTWRIPPARQYTPLND
ncbi:hypothetical protein A2U01_0108256, partial [Trifolium medium]|nr:hypothetical protein [Trifolium medium]